jgi:arginyl-tRNA synthetase
VGFKETIERCFSDAVEKAGFAGSGQRLVLEKPRDKGHGDIATPIAMSLAREFKKNPMEIAESIAARAVFPPGTVASAEVAKPGYINLRIAGPVLAENLAEIRAKGEAYGSSDLGGGRKCQVEYVSANPTGPLVVVSARAAAVGSSIVNLLRAVGYRAESEYYVNDYGNQVETLGTSLRFRVRENRGLLEPGEEIGAYPGDYLKALAAEVPDSKIGEWEADPSRAITGYGAYATEALLATIREDLDRFGARFDHFFRESTLHPDGIAEARSLIEQKGYAYVEDGALHFRTTAFGDEKDRVLVKSDGKATYFLGDIAYHLTKVRRGYDWIIDILGPDHHGHIPRMKAAAAVLGADDKWFQALLVGWVRLMEGGRQVSMSKRAGEFVTLRDLISDVGTDVAKYFFLMRRADSPLDFDLELARKQSDENPVYYVQYAHARISSVLRFASEKTADGPRGAADLTALCSSEERDLMVHLLFFPYVVEGAALSREPHRMTIYAKELATLFHQFYHAHRIVTDDARATAARLYLAEATMTVLRNTLALLGVSAPSSM